MNYYDIFQGDFPGYFPIFPKNMNYYDKMMYYFDSSSADITGSPFSRMTF